MPLDRDNIEKADGMLGLNYWYLTMLHRKTVIQPSEEFGQTRERHNLNLVTRTV